MTERHYTAWMANDASVLMGDCMDVTVIEDVATSYKEEVLSEEYDPETGKVTRETVETPVWESQGQQMFYAETDVDVRDGDAQDGIRKAEALMEKAGWKVVGDWEATDNSYIATVEYVGEYRHVIEATDNAEDPTWYEVIRGDQAEEHDDIPEEYGLLVLENYWPDNGLKVPPLADEYGNPYYRVLVRTQDDDATLAVVESSAAGMTPAAFKTTREMLGLSDGWLADHLGVSSRTVRNWEAGKYPIPHGVAVEVGSLKRETQAEVGRLVAALHGKPAPRLATYRNDTDFQAANPGSKFPASWHRAVVARVALQVPAVGIDYVGGE
jgi:hypothetical protein